MARFVFNLSGVLRQRKQLERQHQRVVAERQVEVNRLTDELRRMDSSVQQSIADVRENRLTGRLDLSFLTAHRRYALSMRRRATDQARRIVAAQQQLDSARLELGEAAKQRKIIEKLRDKRYQQWRSEMDHKEMMQMDEIGTQMSLKT